MKGFAILSTLKLQKGNKMTTQVTRTGMASVLVTSPQVGPSQMMNVGAIAPTVNPASAKLDTQKIVKDVSVIVRILKIGDEVKLKTLRCLEERDVHALQIALGKDKTLLATTHKHLFEKHIEKILADKLAENPEWTEAVKSWTKVSLADKIWLLRLYELFNINLIYVDMDPQTGKCLGYARPLPQLKKKPAPGQHSLELLQPAKRKEVEAFLSQIDFYDKQFSKVPKSFDPFCLLPDLTRVSLYNHALQKAPDFSLNGRIRELVLQETSLTTAPNVCSLPNLIYLDLRFNQIGSPPDLSQNPALTYLFMGNNKLNVAPNVRNNRCLKELDLQFNEITVPSDLLQNVALSILNMNHNRLATPPDVSRNLVLRQIHLEQNHLTEGPDIRNNVQLIWIQLSYNQIKNGVGVSNNMKLQTYEIENNPLSKKAKRKLQALQEQRPQLRLLFGTTT